LGETAARLFFLFASSLLTTMMMINSDELYVKQKWFSFSKND